MTPEVVYISLGSNLGNREETLMRARTMIDALCGVMITGESSVYETAPVGMQNGTPPFLNQVVQCACVCEPLLLLKQLEAIEQQLGRNDKGNYQSRTIDLDILLFGSRVMTTDRLTIPHKQLSLRPFALVPLVEIASDITEPGTGKRFSEYLLQHDTDTVMPIASRFAGMHG